MLSLDSSACDPTVFTDPAWVAVDAQDREGTQIGRYRLVEHIGTGGMGSVWSAVDPLLDRTVALKIMRRPTGDETQCVLAEEGRALARVRHDNVVEVFEVGRARGRSFVAMELIDGVDLRLKMRDASVSRLEVLGALLEAGRGLAAAHDAGLVHRDFKPANVVVGSDGRARIIDFGLATEAEEGATADEDDTLGPELGGGTLAYMAPEQHGTGPITAAADQFAFCVTLYEALTGERPFDADTSADYALDKRGGAPRIPSRCGVSRRWRNAIARGLEPDPARRFSSMRALLQALGTAADSVDRMPLRASIAVAAIIACAVLPGCMPG